jgi:hypothetical protein
MTALAELRLNKSYFTGALPPALTKLTQLESLYLDGNLDLCHFSATTRLFVEAAKFAKCTCELKACKCRTFPAADCGGGDVAEDAADEVPPNPTLYPNIGLCCVNDTTRTNTTAATSGNDDDKLLGVLSMGLLPTVGGGVGGLILIVVCICCVKKKRKNFANRQASVAMSQRPGTVLGNVSNRKVSMSVNERQAKANTNLQHANQVLDSNWKPPEW